MPCMPEHISKPPIIVRMDRLLSSREGQLQFLDKLRQETSLVEAMWLADLLEENNHRNIDEKRHLREDWFTPKDQGGWWTSRPGEIEGTIREGMVQAIEIALQKNLPVDTVWICAGRDEGSVHHAVHDDHDDADHDVMQVQSFISWTERQVSLMFLTPEEPHGALAQFENKPKAGAPWHEDHRIEDVKPEVYRRYTDAEKRRSRGMLVIKPNVNGDLLTKPVDRVVAVESVDEIRVAPP